jgi:hypothetical protein
MIAVLGLVAAAGAAHPGEHGVCCPCQFAFNPEK